ncbi:Receptor-like protein 44 [Bienertia sinuspersici]
MKKHRYFFLFSIFSLLQLNPTISDPNDEACLTQLYASFVDPTQTLKNWTTSNFADPCNGFDSHLQGATCNNGRIFRLSLSSLNLRGTISPSLSKCTNLQTLDLSSNSLSGEIPSELKDLSNLAVLNLSGNRLSGQIPPSLYLCAYLNVIDLHGNQLVGPIPQQLGLLVRLTTLDVSFNKLSGMIPASIGNRSGNMPRFNATSFQGNKDLYGYPLEPYKNKGLSVMAIVGIGLGSGFLSLIVSFTVVCIWLKVSEQKLAAAEEGKISHLMPDY